jgi:hypothetical protein
MSLAGRTTEVALSEARVDGSGSPEPKSDVSGTTMRKTTVRGLDLGRTKDAPIVGDISITINILKRNRR